MAINAPQTVDDRVSVPAVVPGSNVSQSGQTSTGNVPPVGYDGNANDPSSLDRDSLQRTPQAGFPQGTLPPNGGRPPAHVNSRYARNQQSFNVFAQFDEGYTGVQPAEFYQCNSATLNRRGYF